MIVVLTAEAEQDLDAIASHIARDNPPRALTFLQEIRDQCLGLATMPERFPLVPRYAAHGIRKRSHGNYLIFYRAEHDRIVIVHILHGARDYLSILDPD